MFNPEIIYEDAELLVINKPYGVVVNKAESVSGETVQGWMEERLGGALEGLGESEEEVTFLARGGIAHRLDRDTSGVLVLCKTPAALAAVMRQFQDRDVHKEYLALVHARLLPLEGTIRLPMGRSRSDRQSFAVDPEGKIAETAYIVEGFYTLKNADHKQRNLYQQGFSLVRLLPKTGRTHQIRVHLAHFQHPLVGDVKYVGRKRALLDVLWCPRQFLHAEQISFTHPRTLEVMTFRAPLAADLQQVMERLEKLAL